MSKLFDLLIHLGTLFSHLVSLCAPLNGLLKDLAPVLVRQVYLSLASYVLPYLLLQLVSLQFMLKSQAFQVHHVQLVPSLLELVCSSVRIFN